MLPTNRVRTIAAFLITPFFAVFIVPVGACVSSLAGSGSCDVDLGWTPDFLGAAFGATIIAGVPLYLMLKRFGLYRWWYCGVVGVIVGLVASTVIKLIDPGFAWFGLTLLVAPIGFLSGVLFWLVAEREHQRVPG